MTDVSVTLRPPHLCSSEGHKHGASIESFINLGDTLLQITRKWKTAKTWFLGMLLICQSSIVSQVLDFIHWTVTIFSSDHMTGENREIIARTDAKIIQTVILHVLLGTDNRFFRRGGNVPLKNPAQQNLLKKLHKESRTIKCFNYPGHIWLQQQFLHGLFFLPPSPFPTPHPQAAP